MKINRWFLVWCVVILAASFCFTEIGLITVQKVFAGSNEIQTITGKIKSINFCNDIKCGNRSTLVIIYDEKDSEMTFEVRTGIGISALAENKLFTLRDLKKDDIVSIEYIITRSGINKIQTMELKRYR